MKWRRSGCSAPASRPWTRAPSSLRPRKPTRSTTLPNGEPCGSRSSKRLAAYANDRVVGRLADTSITSANCETVESRSIEPGSNFYALRIMWRRLRLPALLGCVGRDEQDHGGGEPSGGAYRGIPPPGTSARDFFSLGNPKWGPGWQPAGSCKISEFFRVLRIFGSAAAKCLRCMRRRYWTGGPGGFFPPPIAPKPTPEFARFWDFGAVPTWQPTRCDAPAVSDQ